MGNRRNKSQVETIFASAARTVTTASTGSGISAQFDDVIFILNCTAIGATTALELVYQISPDGGTTWVDLAPAGGCTATGVSAVRISAPIGHYMRVNAVITGASATVTFSLLADFGIRG